jgi:DNA repair exonuclease SbcCD nuclease subunit
MKYLITGDVHIDDYVKYNLSPKQRLLQFPKLAKLYVELGKVHKCDRIILAGDTLNKATNRPYVENIVREFITKKLVYHPTSCYMKRIVNNF